MNLYSRPTFIIGALVKLAIIITLSPVSVTDWYVPFLDSIDFGTVLDPWSNWIDSGGSGLAFPYGYVMYLAFLPLIVLCKVVNIPLFIGYGTTLLIADALLLFLLCKLVPSREKALILTYWYSPIVLMASYLLGFNDLVPICLLFGAVCAMRKQAPGMAGVLLVLSVSAKLSMILAIPFFVLYFLRARPQRKFIPAFVKGLAVGILIFLLPFFMSDSGMQMLMSNPEMIKVYSLSVGFGGDISIYIVPLAYMLIFYGAWRVRRMNFELFQYLLGLSFLLVVLLTPASPGWFIWIVPMLVMYQVCSGTTAIILGAAFSVLYVLGTFLTHTTGPIMYNLDQVVTNGLFALLPERLVSLLHTALVTVGIIFGLRVWRESITRNDYFRLSRRPFVIGIAGDSGSGKDTLVNAIEGLFGQHSVTKLSGDDYHLWDRSKPIWRATTHLNPMANDLESYANDLVSLIDGKLIYLRRYDHSTGIRSEQKKLQSNDFILAFGLHTLFLPILRNSLNLRIYLGMDEGLRRHLKTARDVQHRGHSIEKVLSSFEKRESDSRQFIRPQEAYADLVLSLSPIHPRLLDNNSKEDSLRLKLSVKSRNGLSELSLIRVLVGVCGLHVDLVSSHDAAEVELTIEGDTTSDDVALAAKLLCPRALEFLDTHPRWQNGVLGIMQLVTLSHINQALTRRFL